MSDTRPRRAVLKRFCVWTAVVVTLMAGYVFSFFATEWLVGSGTIPKRGAFHTAYAPLSLYIRSDLPGSVEFFAVAIWCQSNGELSLDGCRTVAIQIKEGR